MAYIDIDIDDHIEEASDYAIMSEAVDRLEKGNNAAMISDQWIIDQVRIRNLWDRLDCPVGQYAEDRSVSVSPNQIAMF